MMWTSIAQHISNATQSDFSIEQQRSVRGGCINQGYCLIGSETRYFVKLNQAAQAAMFEAEALGLKQMIATQTLRLPHPICWGTVNTSSYLVLEWLDLGRAQGSAWAKMGQQLAHMHQVRSVNQFGWEINNTIGSTPQINTWTKHWADFFAEQRIGYQLKLACRKGGDFGNIEPFIDLVKAILRERRPHPSLVHGDLWSGNASVTTAGEPVIFDPATYYGDHEVDVAMTELFGGFPATFYQGYQSVLPLDVGYQQRKVLYNLYHIINHYNLFGGGYGSQAIGMMNTIKGFI